MRVGIIAVQHESNTFITAPTTWDRFEQHGALLKGPQIRQEYGEAHHEVGGFFAGLEEQQIEAVPILLAWTMPGGAISADALNKLLAMILDELHAAGELDGLLVAPHGAAVAEGCPDMDGFWLRELRARLGPQKPIVGTLDLHANLSETMVRATDALIAYRTNPHLDQRERGVEAAHLIGRMLRGEVHPTQAAAFPPLAINIERQHSSSSPCQECYEALGDMLADKRVLSASLLLGFPYADVREMGSSVIVVTNDDDHLAHTLARQFAEYLELRHNDFTGHMIDIVAAVELGMKLPGPVCLLDMGDNVGGGSPGDGTLLLQAICRRGEPKAFVCLADPESVAQADAAGVGKKIAMRLGGKSDTLHGTPVETDATVVSLHDGRFSELQVRHGGRTNYDMGRTAIVRLASGPTVMLTSERVAPYSLEQLKSCGLNPHDFQILVAKGVHAPVAAYAPVCDSLLRVNTPGVTTADMTALEYHHRRRPLYPFEKI